MERLEHTVTAELDLQSQFLCRGGLSREKDKTARQGFCRHDLSFDTLFADIIGYLELALGITADLVGPSDDRPAGSAQNTAFHDG